MGAEFSITKLMGLDCCSESIKYVFNDCESDCTCSECCDCHVKTNPVDLESEAIDVDVSDDGLHFHG